MKKQNPQISGISAEKLLAEITALPTPDKKATVKQLGELYKQLQTYDGTLNIFQETAATLAWRKGEILNRLYHINPLKRKDSILDHGEYGPWREKYCHKESGDKLERCRKINYKRTLESVKGKTISEVLSDIHDSEMNETPKKANTKPKTNTTEWDTNRDVPILSERIKSNFGKIIFGIANDKKLLHDTKKTRETIKDTRVFLSELNDQIPEFEDVLNGADDKIEAEEKLRNNTQRKPLQLHKIRRSKDSDKRKI